MCSNCAVVAFGSASGDVERSNTPHNNTASGPDENDAFDASAAAEKTSLGAGCKTASPSTAAVEKASRRQVRMQQERSDADRADEAADAQLNALLDADRRADDKAFRAESISYIPSECLPRCNRLPDGTATAVCSGNSCGKDISSGSDAPQIQEILHRFAIWSASQSSEAAAADSAAPRTGYPSAAARHAAALRESGLRCRIVAALNLAPASSGPGSQEPRADRPTPASPARPAPWNWTGRVWLEVRCGAPPLAAAGIGKSGSSEEGSAER